MHRDPSCKQEYFLYRENLFLKTLLLKNTLKKVIIEEAEHKF
jgi:hypothetical protein